MIRTHDIHEQAVADMVRIVDRAVKHRVVENEQGIIPPIVDRVVYLDEDLSAVDRIKVVKDAEREPDRAEMP